MTFKYFIGNLGILYFIFSKIKLFVQGQHGEVCGGFSDVPWAKTSFKGKYVASEKAFLFTLVNDQDLPPTKFPVVKKMFAICYHPE